jgi:hypothetical protein
MISKLTDFLFGASDVTDIKLTNSTIYRALLNGLVINRYDLIFHIHGENWKTVYIHKKPHIHKYT